MKNLFFVFREKDGCQEVLEVDLSCQTEAWGFGGGARWHFGNGRFFFFVSVVCFFKARLSLELFLV